jgi:hypothetical protein
MAVKRKYAKRCCKNRLTRHDKVTHSNISPGEHMDETENLKSGHLLNGDAIQLLANSVSQISSIIAEIQAKAKPSTDE